MAETQAAKTPATKEPAKEFYGPTGTAKQVFVIPNPGVTINGKHWLGRSELTYDERANVESILSNRMRQELRSRFGEKDATVIMDMAGGVASLIGGGSDLF